MSTIPSSSPTLATTMSHRLRTERAGPRSYLLRPLQLPWPHYTTIARNTTGTQILYVPALQFFPAYHEANGCCEQDAASDQDSKSFRPRARFAPTPIEQHIDAEEPYYTSNSIQQELLPSSLARSPPGRSSTLPPGVHSLKPNRPRKSSVGQHARRGKHERQKSREFNRRLSYERKAYSAEPATAAAIMGKRWEDLIDAAASATEEDSRDLTPVGNIVKYFIPSNSNRCHSLQTIHLT